MRPRGVTVSVPRDNAFDVNFNNLSNRTFYVPFAIKYLVNKHDACGVIRHIEWRDGSHLVTTLPAIRGCLESRKRFTFIPLLMKFKGDELGHANALFVDSQNGTVERFEPFGPDAGEVEDYDPSRLDREIGLALKSIGLRYIPPDAFCPSLGGPQHFESKHENFVDYCTTWSLWYADMRLTYPDEPIQVLVAAMLAKLDDMKTTPGEIKRYIVAYASQVYLLMITEFPQYVQAFTDIRAFTFVRGYALLEFFDAMESLIEDVAFMVSPPKVTQLLYTPVELSLEEIL